MTDVEMQNPDHSNERAIENRDDQTPLANRFPQPGFAKNEAIAHQNFSIPLQDLPPSIDTSEL